MFIPKAKQETMLVSVLDLDKSVPAGRPRETSVGEPQMLKRAPAGKMKDGCNQKPPTPGLGFRANRVPGGDRAGCRKIQLNLHSLSVAQLLDFFFNFEVARNFLQQYRILRGFGPSLVQEKSDSHSRRKIGGGVAHQARHRRRLSHR